ncbi:MAG: aromatic ring-hydroxylating dioxygenase subunit alpha [Burkholderiales bacterium]|nr:aromatic ring-hydroxylating dioxygenase subunit alpha [Burkholderiales bacterium]
MRAEQNELLTRIGPGTPAGALLRRYWQPVALEDELQGERPVKAVRLLGEDLVLFRDPHGRYGLIERHCPHRGADLAYGRLEDGGLRCAFHGWLFDVDGRCRETPAEPLGSRLHESVRCRAYPVVRRSGVLWAWLGGSEPAAFPHLDCFVAPDSHVFAFKGYWDCNWLQALEVGIDPAHASFLHRFFEDEDPAHAYGRQFRSASMDSELPMTKLLREYDRPEIRVERTAYGIRLCTLRHMNAEKLHLRVTNVVFPQAFVIPMSAEMTISQWHVPVDDTGTYWYALFTSFGAPVDKATMRAQRLATYPAPDYKPIFNRANHWGYDPQQQRRATYTGMGFDINIHDQWACESQGPIADRTREHLGTTDKGIVLYRRILADAIRRNAAGERPLMVLDEAAAAAITGPAAIDAIAPAARWEEYWRDADRRRRRECPWPAPAERAA